MRTHRLLLVLVLLLAWPSRALADEIFVLDDGQVLRGWVVRESDKGVLIRLTGFAGDAQITIPKRRLVHRYDNERRGPRLVQPEAAPDESGPTEVSHEETWERRDTAPVPPETALPATEPPPRGEGFFQRLARVTVMAMPDTTGQRFGIGLALLAALMVLLAIGGRIAEIDAMGLWRAVCLAMFLGAFLVADVFRYDELLRADRAILVLPGEGLAWLGAATAVLRVGFARTVLLFAFVLFSLTLIVLTSGAILVNF